MGHCIHSQQEAKIANFIIIYIVSFVILKVSSQ